MSIGTGTVTSSELARKRRDRPGNWWVASLALVLLGVLLVILGFQGPKSAPNISGPIGKTSMSDVARTQLAAPVSPPLALAAYQMTATTAVSHRIVAHRAAVRSRVLTEKRSRPVHIWIPKIGVSAPLSELGLNPNGSPEAPTSWGVPGWYKLGPTPGQLGSAVITGHVDSIYGPAVFYLLANLRPGNKINVRLADGVTAHFVVIGLREYLKTRFPDQLVYGRRNYSALQLATCAGTFDYQTHHYLSNIVVFAKLVKN